LWEIRRLPLAARKIYGWEDLNSESLSSDNQMRKARGREGASGRGQEQNLEKRLKN
jgi:hypothetical protein